MLQGALLLSRGTALVACLTVLFSATASSKAEEITVNTVVTKLRRPSGIAMRPGGSADRYELFIAESGAGTISRWRSSEPEKAATVIQGFSTEAESNERSPVLPLSLTFLDPGLVIVGAPLNNHSTGVRVFE